MPPFINIKKKKHYIGNCKKRNCKNYYAYNSRLIVVKIKIW